MEEEVVDALCLVLWAVVRKDSDRFAAISIREDTRLVMVGIFQSRAAARRFRQNYTTDPTRFKVVRVEAFGL